jgi:type VI protein secretion system component VasK
MWILSFVPDSLLHFAILAILFTGAGLYAVTFFFRFIPAALIYQLTPYKSLISVLSVVLMVAGVYFYGAYDTEMSWRKKVEAAEAAVAEAEKKSESANVLLEAERKKKQKVITEYAITVKERIIEKEKIIDAECKLSPDAVQLFNDAAKNPAKVNK